MSPAQPHESPHGVPETYDLFLCHNAADKDLAREIGSYVENTLWEGRSLRVFLDEWDIVPGDNFILRLEAALDAARYIAVLLSPEMVTSAWCRAEVCTALATDPTNRRGRLIPILVRDKDLSGQARLDIPPFLRALHRLDFRTVKQQRRELERLVAFLRGDPSPRGRGRARPARPVDPLVPALPERADAPDEIEENLVSNLLLVSSLPKTVWSMPTKLRRLSELPKGVHLPPAIPREGQLITFTHPDDPAFDAYKAGPAKSFTVQEWRHDESRWRWVIELLNRSLTGYLYAQWIRHDVEHRRYYFAARGTEPVKLRWGIGKSRCVVRPPDVGKGIYWVHHAARIAFQDFGRHLYLAIDPTWVFTVDGRKPIKREAIPGMAARWGGRERNATILRHVLLWADVLTQGRDRYRVPCGSQSMTIERIPRTVAVPVGLSTDLITTEALLAFTGVDEPPSAPDHYDSEEELEEEP